MKKAIATLCLLGLVVTCVQAQYIRRWSISLTLGPSIPVGKFASTNGHDSTSQFAQTGLAANLTFSYRLSKHWGFSMLLNGEDNAVNNAAIDGELETASPANTYQYNRAHWQIHRLLAGAYGEWPVGRSNRWTLTIGMYAGGVATQLPKVTVYETSRDQTLGGGNSSSYTEYIAAHRYGFAYEGNAGLRYKLGKLLYLCGQVGYTGSWVNMVYGAHSLLYVPPPLPAGNNFQNRVPVPTYWQPIAAINVTVGVGIHL